MIFSVLQNIFSVFSQGGLSKDSRGKVRDKHVKKTDHTKQQVLTKPCDLLSSDHFDLVNASQNGYGVDATSVGDCVTEGNPRDLSQLCLQATVLGLEVFNSILILGGRGDHA